MRLNNSFKLALAALMILLPGIAWGGGGGATTYQYSATLTATASGEGKVYVSKSDESPSDQQWNNPDLEETSSSGEIKEESWSTTLYAHAKADTGYEFTGWDKEGTDKAKPKTVTFSLTKDKTEETKNVTAYFSAKDYHIMYEDTGDETIQTRTYHINDNAFTLPSPTWAGYDFGGWKIISESDCTNWESLNAVIQPSTSISNRTGDVTLEGQWNPIPYTITYTSEETCTDLPDPNTQQYDIETNQITLSDAVPKRDGYEFTGWTASFEQGDSDHGGWESRTYSNGEEITTNNQYYGNVTLTANWTPEGDPHYIKVTVSDMKKDDHAIFDITYGSVNQQIAIHEFAIVKIPGRYEAVTVKPSRWTEKTYNITPATGYTGIDVSFGTRNDPTMFEFSAEQKSGQNIFETSREF